MLSTLKMRNQTIKFSALSQLNPDYYFIQGYFMGIGSNPHLVPTSQWMKELFGEVDLGNEEQNEYIQALMQLYNLHMASIMQAEIKLPTKCTLSKTDLKGSLAPEAPLPNWCLGMLKALKLIDKKRLTAKQLLELDYALELLTTFSDYNEVTKLKSATSDDYQAEAHSLKRYLSTAIHNLIYFMRFESDEEASEENSDDNEVDSADAEFKKMMHFVMTEEGAETIELIDTMVKYYESTWNKNDIKNNQGMLWLDHDARPYLLIRARRAQLNFLIGNTSLAIDELQALLVLNHNDNQANRYPLANYLVLQKRWAELELLLQQYDEESVFTLASKALMLFAQEGDSNEAQRIKKQLKKSNKHLEKYLTGQSKTPKSAPGMYSPGDKAEAFTYLSLAGKDAWRSVEGALFWLRRK